MATANAKGPDTNSKRPSDSAFKQQRLPAWQPILTAGTVLPTFFVIGIAFIPVGVILLHISDQVQEFSTDYTDCLNANNKSCAEVIESPDSPTCECKIPFVLDKAFNAPVMMYYGLTNFYQNHRRYVKSRDDNQLRGQIDPQTPTAPSSDCQPFAYDDDKRPILPCGAIANSLFSDELYLYRDDEEVPLLKTGIAWPSDKSIKFHNPQGDLREAEPLQQVCENPFEYKGNELTRNGGTRNWPRPKSVLSQFKKVRAGNQENMFLIKDNVNKIWAYVKSVNGNIVKMYETYGRESGTHLLGFTLQSPRQLPSICIGIITGNEIVVHAVFKKYAKPKNWQRNLWELDKNNTANNGLQNEDLIVWMRTAALPTFRKLYRRINHTSKNYTEGLPAGNYTLIVKYSYQVKSFEGTKKMILSTTSGLGGKNPFLGIAYIVVGAICFLLGIVFLFIHIKCGKSTSEMINVSQRTPYQ